MNTTVDTTIHLPPDAFRWPAPPYFDFSPYPDEAVPEQCLVVLVDAQKLQGELLHFNPDAALLELNIPASPIGPKPGFTDIVQLHLLRPLLLKRQELPPEVTEEEIYPVSEQQTYNVELNSGEILSGETRGFVNAQCGVFLFPPAGVEQVTRYFVPAAQIKAFQIGDPVGQLLIEQNIASEEAVTAALHRQHELRQQKLGDLLTDNRIVSVEELAVALKHQQLQPILRLGEVLIDLGLLTADELASALKKQERNRKIPLGQILIEMGVVDQEIMKSVMAKKLGIPFVNLSKFRILKEVISKVPASLAQRHCVIPVFQTNAALIVAIENPLATAVLEELRFMTGTRILPVMAVESDIRAAIHKYYGNAIDHDGRSMEPLVSDDSKDGLAFYHAIASDSRIDTLASQLAAEGDELELVDDQVIETDTTLVKLINKMILDAHEQRASDIHIETYPGKQNTRIRFRKDGVLSKYLELPSKFRNSMVSRIKIMSTLDISERRKAQDGKMDFSRFGPARLELRVATIPTNNGLEDVVMRLLTAAKPLPIEQLGFSEEVLRNVQRMVTKPHGLCLVCGPTGSGKTTTLHSLLGFINTDGRKIWTAEDPIEITQAGLRQVQVNAKIGWTFAAAMRSFLRADPDVIMVGEMRDAETTKTGIEASLTGHLVLSTLHTNSAPESVVRLLDMGMDPFNFADALLGILAQRLTRRLCPLCRQAYAPTPTEIDELLKEYCQEGTLDTNNELASWRKLYADPKGNIILYRASGCDKCAHTGYQGRVGLHEFMLADATVKHLIQTRATVTEIKAVAMVAGMHTLKQNGIEKVLQGLTDMSQVRAVCG
jgi:type II secretory ATPase GspE/PulE/Tfp pilus assembly ATPase PilB-like protein